MEHSKRKNKIKNKRYSILIMIGVFFIFLGSSYLIYNQYNNEKQDSINDGLIEDYFKVEDEIIETPQKEIEEEKPVPKEKIDYIAVLEIPKIKLKRGIVDKNSSYNNVNRNIYTLKETTMPDEEDNSHIMLASHSGNSYISYFKNLNKLNLNDEVYFFYKNNKYVYKVIKKYEVEKTGTVKLSKKNSSDITLITCVSGTNNQIVLVANLESIENY
jgi:sortase family protein